MNKGARQGDSLHSLQVGMKQSAHYNDEKLYNWHKRSRRSKHNVRASLNIELLSSDYYVNVWDNTKDLYMVNPTNSPPSTFTTSTDSSMLYSGPCCCVCLQEISVMSACPFIKNFAEFAQIWIKGWKECWARSQIYVIAYQAEAQDETTTTGSLKTGETLQRGLLNSGITTVELDTAELCRIQR